MRRVLIALSAAAVIATPMFTLAQTKDQSGHSESAPGQRATKPGGAKEYAPGQEEKMRNKDKQPGAKEYAPGHQTK